MDPSPARPHGGNPALQGNDNRKRQRDDEDTDTEAKIAVKRATTGEPGEANYSIKPLNITIGSFSKTTTGVEGKCTGHHLPDMLREMLLQAERKPGFGGLRDAVLRIEPAWPDERKLLEDFGTSSFPYEDADKLAMDYRTFYNTTKVTVSLTKRLTFPDRIAALEEEIHQKDQKIQQLEEEVRQGDPKIKLEERDHHWGDQKIKELEEKARQGDRKIKELEENAHLGDQRIKQLEEQARQGDQKLKQLEEESGQQHQQQEERIENIRVMMLKMVQEKHQLLMENHELTKEKLQNL